MIKDLLVYIHLLCVIYTMGKVMHLDLQHVLVYMRTKTIKLSIAPSDHRCICYGLLAMSVTGLFLVLYGVHTSGLVYLTNPKLQAKVLTVVLLSINGLLLHKWVLKGLYGTYSAFVWVSMILGSLSGCLWLLACFIGVAKSLSGNPIVLWVAAGGVALCSGAWLVAWEVVKRNKCNSA